MHARHAAFWKWGFAALIAIVSAFMLANAGSGSARHLAGTRNAFLAGTDVPPPVRAILERSCSDCHSAQTRFPWYANLPPVSWKVHRDVAHARAAMDLSRWNGYTDGERRGFRLAIGALAGSRLMPPPAYLWIHRRARLSPADLDTLRTWAAAKTRNAQTR